MRGAGAPVVDPAAVSRLELGYDHADLMVLADWLAKVVADHALPGRAAFHLELVLTEAVTNVMDYAGTPSPRDSIEIRFSRDAAAMRVEVRDSGPPFDPTRWSAGDTHADLASAQVGGWGIQLMRSYASDMHYQRDGNRNILVLTLPVDGEAVDGA